MDASKERALDLFMQSWDNAVATMKLKFGVSTGAVVLFVHAIVDSQIGPVLAAILTGAALCFGFSAIQCLKLMTHVAGLKSAIAEIIWLKWEDLDLAKLEQRANIHLEGGHTKLNQMDRFFAAGVVFSVTFLIVHLVANLARR